MPEYTVEEVGSFEDWISQDGKQMRTHRVTLSGIPNVQLTRWQSKPPPVQGEKVEGEIKDTPKGKKFKKAQNPEFANRGNGGGTSYGGGRSPEENLKIVRQSSTARAISILELSAQTGKTPEEVWTKVREVASWLDEDVKAVAA